MWIEDAERLQEPESWILGLMYSEDEFEAIVVLFKKRYEILAQPFINVGERFKNRDPTVRIGRGRIR
jgi:hypothetical protein